MKKTFGNKLFKVFFSAIKTLVIVLIVAYLVFISIQRLSGNKSILGYRLFTIATGSMTGVYDIDDVIAVKDCDTNSLKVGDDIAYQGMRGSFESKLITHRIVKIEDDDAGGKIFYTKGVNSKVVDPSITDKQILGKVEGVVPVITTINHVVKSQAGFFLLIFCPLVIVIVFEVLQTITSIRLEKNELEEVSKKEDKDNDSEDTNKDDLEVDDKKEEIIEEEII